MKRTRIATITGLLLLTAVLWLLPSVGRAATVTVDCNAGGTIHGVLSSLKPGDTLLVSGTCNENVFIGEDKHNITLDGQGRARINGPARDLDTVEVTGRAITVKGFAITGGRNGIIVQLGGMARIESNTIQNAGAVGILVAHHGFAQIVNNTIQNNPRGGITLTGVASAYIGFLSIRDTAARPNTIQGNGSQGITLIRSSHARVIGNTISNNKLNGVDITRASQADVASNTISGNGQDGIFLSANSGVNLGSDTGTGIYDSPNTTTANNGGAGIRCSIGSYAAGRLGTLTGAKGAKDFDTTCIDRLIPTQ